MPKSRGFSSPKGYGSLLRGEMPPPACKESPQGEKTHEKLLGYPASGGSKGFTVPRQRMVAIKRKEVVIGMRVSVSLESSAPWSQQMGWESALTESHVSSSCCFCLKKSRMSQRQPFISVRVLSDRAGHVSREDLICYYRIRGEMQHNFPNVA